MAVSKDLYALLGLNKSASDAEIKKAYRKLAKELHPDRNPNDAKIAERFKTITAAYTILSDAEKRQQYDRGEINSDGQPNFGFGGGGGRSAGADPFADIFTKRGGGGNARSGFGFNFDDLFSGGAAGGGRAPRRGQDIHYKLEIPFVDAALAREQRLTLENGRTIDLKVPAGLVSGQKMKLAGQGRPGEGGAGDAIISLAITPHPLFRREGNDILIDLPVSLSEAVKGSKVRAPTPEGAVMVSIPPGSSSGKVLRLREKGFTAKDGKRGDLLIRLEVAIPTGDPALRAFVDSWGAGDSFNPRKAAGLE